MPTPPARFTRIFACLLHCSLLLFIFAANGNAQMRQLYEDPNANNHINKISFYTASSGYVAFARSIAFTSDSGRTYSQRPITISNVDYGNYPSVNLTFGFGISGVKAFNQNTLIAYGDYGWVPAILRSIDGGLTWKLVYHSQFNPMALAGAVNDMVFPENSSIGFAVDADRILKTTNGGQTWFATYVDPAAYYTAIEAVDNNNVFAISNDYTANRLVKTTNGGSSWQRLTVPTGSVNYASFLTAQKGWLTMTSNDNSSYAAVYYTSNGGSSWTLKNDPLVTPYGCLRMKFINDSTGYGINGMYNLYKTTDSGKVWQRVTRNNNYEYLYYYHFDLHFWNNDQFWAGGGHGFLEITTNGGGTPLPGAFFKIDTTGLYQGNLVKLVNYSKPGYQYQWYRNNTLISSSYHANYTHAVNDPYDSIKLVVSDGVRSDSLKLYQRFTVPEPPIPPQPYVGWVLKPTNINDHFRDIRVLGNVAVLIGDEGLYYNTTGINNANGWTKYNIPTATSASDSALLAHTKFKQLAFNETSTVFYAVGNDTIDNKAIIFRVDPLTLAYSFVYKGAPNTFLHSMIMTNTSGNGEALQAVGKNGLYVFRLTASGQLWTDIIPGQRELIKIINLPSAINNIKIGILSADSILYSGSEGSIFQLAYFNNTGRKMISADGIASQRELATNGDMLYFTFNANNFFTLDSITKSNAPAPLRYNVIATTSFGFHRYVGTNKGIYKANVLNPVPAGTEAIEYQPTSLGKNITNIWFRQKTLQDTGYAVGPNGTLLATHELGGPTIPYAEITTTGNCLGSPTLLRGMRGTGTSCKWYIDDVFHEENCSNNGFVNFATTGFHTIKYIVSNVYGLADTVTKSIFISQPPVINLPVTFSDTILCKSESILVSLQNTQPGYRYEVISESSGASFGFANSNSGGILNFNTTQISQSGNYFIRVSSINGGCTKNFTTKTFIKVEHTKSIFTGNRVNVGTGEPVRYFHHSPEANSFVWTMHEDPSIATATGAATPGISYASTGQKTLTLISISENGCRDTATSNAVWVYNKPLPDDVCYLKPILDSEYAHFPSNPSFMQDVTITPDNGYFISGTGHKPLLDSRYGVNKKFEGDGITYYAKYTTDGVLSWIAHYGGNNWMPATTAVDETGNIYILGNSQVHTYFYLPNGDSMKLAQTPTDIEPYSTKRNGFILKLDADGNYLWHTILDDFKPINSGGPQFWSSVGEKITIRGRHIVISGRFDAKFGYCRNGVNQQLIDLPTSGHYADNLNNFVIKIKDDGTLLWHMYSHHNAVNQAFGIAGIGIDKNGNSYVAGFYEHEAQMHDAGNINNVNLPGATATTNSYLFKYDSTGRYVWKVLFRNANFFRDVEFSSIVTDSIGNSYVTGGTTILSEAHSITLTNSNNTTVPVSLSSYYLLKIDSAGMYRWAQGSKYSYYGRGSSVYLRGNDLYTTGVISNNGESQSTFTMTSADGAHVVLPFHETEFFVCKYDTAGVLKRLVKSGINPGGHTTPNNLVMDAAGNFIIAGFLDNYNGGNNSFSIFSLPITTRGHDGFYGKFNPDFCLSNTTPAANAGPDKATCANVPVTIGTSATSGNYYSWISSPSGYISTVANPSVAPSVTTTYYLSVLNAAGQIVRDTVVVTVLPTPVANAGIDRSICAGNNTTIGSAPVAGNNYSWTSNPAGFNSSAAQPSVNPTVTTTYYLLVSDASTCIAKDTVTVTALTSVTPAVVITGPSSACINTNMTFTASTVTNGGPTPSFQWKLNGNNVGTNSNSYSTSSLVGTDQVRVVMTSSLSCATPATATSNPAQVVIVPNSDPFVSISGPTTVNPSQQVQLIVASSNNLSSLPTWQWQDSTSLHGWQDIANSNTTSIFYTPGATGDRVRCRLSTINPCQSISSYTSAPLTFTINVITSIPSVPGRNYGIISYPNPAQSTFTVDSLRLSDRWETLEIIAQDGKQKLITKTISGQRQVTMQVAKLPAGMYIVLLRQKSGKLAYLRFIKI